MPSTRTTTKIVRSGGGTSSSPSAPPGNYVQRGHTVTTTHYIDGKAVRLNFWDRIRIIFLSKIEKQAFLAQKLLKQEKTQTKVVKRK